MATKKTKKIDAPEEPSTSAAAVSALVADTAPPAVVSPVSVLVPGSDEGLLIAFLRKWLGRSWKTSLAGWASLAGTMITAIATVVESPGVLKWAPIAVQGLMSLGIMLSKDANVSGANRPAAE